MADLTTKFAGIECPNPFWLASGPPANCGDQGRRPIADMDSLVVEWRQKVGDKIRGEFQDALAAVAKA